MVSVKKPNVEARLVDDDANLCQIVTDHIGNADAEVLVTAPALNKRMRHYVSDTDDSDRRAIAFSAIRSRACAGTGSRPVGSAEIPTR